MSRKEDGTRDRGVVKKGHPLMKINEELIIRSQRTTFILVYIRQTWKGKDEQKLWKGVGINLTQE